jgi:hypothetical protein
MKPSLGEARRSLGRRWQELEETVADGTGFRLRKGRWGILALAFCLGLHLAEGTRRQRLR